MIVSTDVTTEGKGPSLSWPPVSVAAGSIISRVCMSMVNASPNSAGRKCSFSRHLRCPEIYGTYAHATRPFKSQRLLNGDCTHLPTQRLSARRSTALCTDRQNLVGPRPCPLFPLAKNSVQQDSYSDSATQARAQLHRPLRTLLAAAHPRKLYGTAPDHQEPTSWASSSPVLSTQGRTPRVAKRPLLFISDFGPMKD